ncbi:MAG: hypothetical protein ACI8W7_003766, partial [Gammaproteobacteria bacterium]
EMEHAKKPNTAFSQHDNRNFDRLLVQQTSTATRRAP